MTTQSRKTKNSNKTEQKSISEYTTPTAAQTRAQQQKKKESEHLQQDTHRDASNVPSTHQKPPKSNDTVDTVQNSDTKEKDITKVQQHNDQENNNDNANSNEAATKEATQLPTEIKQEKQYVEPTQEELDSMVKPSNQTLNPFQQLGERNTQYEEEEQESSQQAEFNADEGQREEQKEDPDSEQKQYKDAAPEEESNTADEEEEAIQNIGTTGDKEKRSSAPSVLEAPPIKFKRINHDSKNRRACARKMGDPEADGSRDKTPDRNQRKTITNVYYSRVTIKLSVEASNDPGEATLSAFNDYLKEMYQVDPTITVHPWKSRGALPVLMQSVPDDFPESFTRLTRYLHKVFLPSKDRDAFLYPQIYIGHDEEFDEIRETMQPWFSSTKQGLYYNMLQVEDAADLGWLCYSTREMDAGALADEIMEAINIPIGLRWKNINSGTRNTSTQNQTKALIVEVSNKHRWQCMTKLLRLYSRSMKSANSYPNGIRLRFVKLKKDCLNKAEKDKMDKLKQRQKAFLEAIQSSPCYEIIQLDYSPSSSNQPTLRQMIMHLTTKADSSVPIFHCVDLDWRQEGYTFQYSPQNADEAETTINTLLPLLKYKFPDADAEGNFTPEAEMRCLSMFWDHEKQMIVDRNCEVETEDFEDDEQLVGFVFDTQVMEELQRPNQRIVMPSDNDSVSTFRPQGAQRSTGRESSNHQSQNDTMSKDVSSVTSTSTHVSEINALESKLASLTSQVLANQQQQDQKYNEIIKAIREAAQAEEKNTNEEASSSVNSGRVT